MADEVIAVYRAEVQEAVKRLNDLADSYDKITKATKASETEAEKAARVQAREAEKAAKAAEIAAQKAARANEKAARETEKAARDAARVQAQEADKAAKASERASARAAAAAAKAAKEQARAAQEAAKAQQAAIAKAEAPMIALQKGLTDQFKGVATTMAAAFAVDRVISFGAESVQLAAKVQGVQKAFERLNDPTLLNELRAATKGTISDMELMQSAIFASNFKIPLENLGTFLKFAGQRARETGKEIDYLMDSMMTAIGRGSIEVWDNMGFSIARVREHLKGASIETISVADRSALMLKLVNEEFARTGEEADSAAMKIAQITAEFENMKAKGGAALIDIADKLAGLSDEKDLSEIQKGIGDAIVNQVEIDKYRRKAFEDTHDIVGQLWKDEERLAEARTEQAKMEAELAVMYSKKFVQAEEYKLIFAKKRLDQAVGFNVIDQKAARDNIKNVEAEITANQVKRKGLEAGIATYKEYLEAKKGANDPDKANVEAEIRNIYFLTNAIKALNEEAAKEGTTRERILEINKQLKPLEEDLAFLKGKQAKEAENAAEYLKKLKEAVGEYSLMLAKSIPGLRQFAVDSNGIGNSLNTLREMLNQAQEQFNSAEINSDAFKQAKADIEALSQAIEEAEGNAQISLDKMYTDVSSGILESAQLTREALEQEAKGMMQIADQLFNAIGTMSQAVTSMTMNAIQAESDAVEQQYRRREITQEQYEARQLQLRRKAAQAQKDQAQFSVLMNTSSAVMNALQTQPFYVGLALAAIAAAMGAAETAAIQSAPLPQFGKGGWVEGKKHSEGGTMIEAEKGEFIVSAAAAKRYAPILEQINKQTFQPPKDGWEGLAASISLNSQFTDRNLLAAIDRHRETDKSGFDKLASAILRASRGHNIRRGWN